MTDRVARSWPAGSGEMASRIRDFDWTKTPLGHIEDWSVSLKVAVQLMLALEYPTHICVGNDWTQLYNDSYAALIGNRHPAALGQDVRKTFAEVNFAGALARVFNGETVTQTDQPYPFMRDGVMEPAWFDFSATPVRDETGAVFAILVLHKETTTGVLAGRTRDELAARQSFLLKLGDALRPIGDPGDAQAEAMRVLGQHLGVSRAQYFEVDSTGQFVDARGGYAENAVLRAGRIRLDDFGRQPRESYETGRTFVVEDTSDLPISSDERKTYEAAGTRSAVGAPVTKAGKLVAVLGVSHRTPRVWSAEDVAIIEETAERIWAAAERARTEASLRESEARYRTMFETIDEGFCVMELVYGENGRIVDLIFRQINRSFQRQTGLSDVAGRTVQELLPNFEQNWIEVYTKVAETGEPQHQENYVQDVARWYRVHFSLIGAKGSRPVAVTFEDISERKRHELLDRVAKDLVSLHSPDEIMETVGAHVGELFRVSGCIVADVNEKHNEVVIHHGWTKDNAPSLKQTFRLKDYLTEEFARDGRAGETFVVRDTTQDERAKAENYAALSIGSFVAVPFRWRGQWTGYVALTSTEPRDWRADEVELLEEISRRLFARLERARAESALRASEEKYRTLFETMDQGFADCELVRDAQGRVIDHRHLEINPAFERLIGYSPGTGTGVKGQEIVPGLDRWWIETFDRIIRAGEPERFEHHVPEIARWFDVNVIPRGADRFLLLFDDITKRKQAEETLRKNEERQTFLLKLSDALRPLMDPLEIMAITSEIVGRFMQVGRCGYAEVPPPYDHLVVARDWTDGVMQSLQGSWPLASFGDGFIRQYRSGETVVLEDSFADARSQGYEAGLEAVGGVRSSIAVQLMKQGQWVASFYVQNTVRRSWTQSEVELMEEIAERTWAALERARAEAALRESEHRFRQFANAASDVVWIRSADTLDMEFVSPVFEDIYGISRDAVMGDLRKWAALIVPDDREQALQRLGQVRHGQPTVHEFRIRRPSDGVFRWISSADFPLSDESGRVQRIGGIGSDITDAKLAVERQAILLAELQHRVRNIMAMIRSVTARTAGGATSVPDYAGLMSGRLMALARTQALLTRAVNKDVDLGTLVRTELAAQAHDEAQYRISGPELAISPKAAEVLSLAIHELATNSLKYGAFVVPEGRVSVSWRVTQEKEQLLLSLLWPETRPPIPNWAPPTGRGLGTELIERRVPYELGGRGKVEITAQGAQVSIEFPLQPGASILETGAPIRSSVFGGSIDMNGEPNLAGHRILIVEDDFFLAYDAETALRGAGADVVGPFSKEAPAIKAIHQGGLTAAVIDINLGQGPSFETARALRQARVPFIFLTGYDQSAILDEFDGVPRFEKPVDTRHIVRALDRLIEESVTD